MWKYDNNLDEDNGHISTCKTGLNKSPGRQMNDGKRFASKEHLADVTEQIDCKENILLSVLD